MKPSKLGKVTLKELKQKATPPPPRELTLREKLVGIYLDNQTAMKREQEKAETLAQEQAWNILVTFLRIPDSKRNEATLYAFDNHPEWGYFLHYEDIRVARDRVSDGYRYVAKCPWCGDLAPSDVFFSSTVGLGEQIFKEDSGTFIPVGSHIHDCPKAPEEAKTLDPTLSNYSPADELVRLLRRVCK
jgi:hypothetical protein